MAELTIREATLDDWPAIWSFFQPIVSAGDTYGFNPNLVFDEARVLWMDNPEITLVAEQGDTILGSYYLKPNQQGPGAHVCNCGYMVSSAARGQGIASQMCAHSQGLAIQLGYLAMQFNFVASTNTGALRLWTRLGFTEVGRLPKAFRHPDAGLVDALVMYKWLQD